ncbi:hypothetical protein QS306_11130 [Paraburkholderia bonniea]|uniref:hypothetical protein n=1 Tax=Paraburkholderia bonniea TaxID=2152891 RepID=UPI0012926436|nr:hypothetical protein [Paraburkholderia bonniea]WJF89656.1 hypothetical protein QS306_11130 [Paraburkholderia bonniea]WJF92970.1 hypothetical protein QS308_11140 [Paraburkholderia bonniea]
MKFSELMKIREKPLEFYRVTFLRIIWFSIFLIAILAMFSPDEIPDGNLAYGLSKMGLVLPRIEEYSRRTSFPFALLVSYGSAFWLGWGGGFFIYLISTINPWMKKRTSLFTPKAMRSSIVVSIILIGFILGRDGEDEPIYWLFRLMTESRVCLAMISGSMLFLNFLTSVMFFYSIEYYVRRYIWQR